MSTEKTAEKFVELAQQFICLRPRLILPEHIVQFRKKLESLKVKMDGASGNPEDHASLFRILILLAQSETPFTMSELSAELNVPMSTATRIADSLVRAELVERFPDATDRRIVRIGMSKIGRELYETGMSSNKLRIANLLKDFSSEEQEQLLKLMNKLFLSLVSENERQK